MSLVPVNLSVADVHAAAGLSPGAEQPEAPAEASIVPELLGTTVISPAMPPAATAVGTVYGLHAIAEGANLNHAIGKIDSDDEQVIAAIRSGYVSRLGNDERATPTDAQRHDARAELSGLHLRDNYFWER